MQPRPRGMNVPLTALGHGCPDLWNSKLGQHGGGSPALGNSWGSSSSPCLLRGPAFSTPQQVYRAFHLVHTSPAGWRETRWGTLVLSGAESCVCGWVLLSVFFLVLWPQFSAWNIYPEVACNLVPFPLSSQKHLCVPGDVPLRGNPGPWLQS